MQPLYFRLLGSVPAKKNTKRIYKKRYGRGFCVLPPLAYEHWSLCNRGVIQKQLFAQTTQDFLPIDFSVCLYVSFFYRTLHKKDSDNSLTSILDLLKDCGVIKDDNWQIVKFYAVSNYSASFDGVHICITKY